MGRIDQSAKLKKNCGSVKKNPQRNVLKNLILTYKIHSGVQKNSRYRHCHWSHCHLELKISVTAYSLQI